MTLRTDVFNRCTTGGHAGLSALIGTRCYPDQRMPTAFTLPLVTWMRVSTNNTYARNRSSAPGRAQVRVQFNCYANTGSGASALADQVVAAWDGYNGSGCPLGICFVANRSGTYEQSLNMYRQIVDVMIERATDT